MGFLLPAMTQEKLDNQRSVVQNERRQRVDNQPYGDWDERIQALVYPPDHQYHHSVIGSMEDLDAATLDDIGEFFRTYYAPNNAVLTVCGDFAADEARRLVEKYFGGLPRGPELPPLPGRPELEARIGSEVRVAVEAAVALPRVYLAYRIPPYGSEGFYPADLAAHLLAAGKASRLYRRLVREQRVAQDIVAYAFPIVTGASMLVLWATAAPGHSLEAVERALLAEVDALSEAPPLAAELQRALTRIESREVIGLQQVGERADHLSHYTTLFDDPGRINTELDRYRAVGAEDVQRMAREYLHAENRVVLSYVPKTNAEAV